MSLSIGDIIGRAARIWRENWKLFARLYLFPEILYVICWELLVAAIENLWSPSPFAIRASIMIVGMLAITGSLFLIRAASYAQWLVMSGSYSNISEAVRASYRFKLLVVYWPSIMVDLFEIACATAMVVLGQEVMAKQVRDAEEILGVTGLYIAFIIAWYVPFRVLKILNVIVAYHLLIAQTTYRAGLADLIVIFSRKPLQIFSAVLLLSCVLSMLEMPAYLFSVVQGILESTTKIPHDVLRWLELIPRGFCEGCIGAICSAILASAVLLFDNEWRIRVEAKDVVENLNKLERVSN